MMRWQDQELVQDHALQCLPRGGILLKWPWSKTPDKAFYRDHIGYLLTGGWAVYEQF